MKLLKLMAIIPVIIALSGCSAFGTWYGETKPMMTFGDLKVIKSNGDELTSKIFVWSPKNSAALINHEGRGCVQGAEVFHAKSGEIDISEDLLAMLTGINKSSTSTQTDKALALKITNDILALRTNSERNTFLSIGMFGLCQLQVNGALNKTDLLTLIESLLTNSLEVGKPISP